MDPDPRAFNAPLSDAGARELVELCAPTADASALDVGCGRGRLLRHWFDAGGGRAVGVDPQAAELDHARRDLADVGERVELHACAYLDLELARPVHVGLCIGASHAFLPPGVAPEGPEAAPRAALTGLRDRVGPGGRVLLGEGFWERTPDPEYLAATGLAADELTSHAALHALGESLGLRTLWVAAASRADFDRFEAGSALAAERRLDAAPDDPRLRELTERRRAWRRAYLRWGRDTFGFGFYLFEVPR